MPMHVRPHSPTARRRDVIWGVLVAFVISIVIGCSSGLGGSGSGRGRGGSAVAESRESTNLRFGFNPGMVLTDPVSAFDLAGGTVPALAVGGTDRAVAFLAFVTAAPSRRWRRRR